MLTWALALGIAVAGPWAGQAIRPRHPGRAALRHVGLVTAATLTVELLGGRLPAAGRYGLEAAWIATLGVAHVGHAVAVAHWGARLSRAVLGFVARNLGDLAATFPRQAAGAAALLVAAAGLGGLAAWADVHCGTTVAARLGWPATLGVMAVAAGAFLATPPDPRSGGDPVLVLLLRARAAPRRVPPFDPELRTRPERAGRAGAGAGRRDTVVLVVIDSLQARALPFHGSARMTAPFLASRLAADTARAVPVAVSPCPSSECALWTLLTSRRARDHAINAETLHGALGRAGYRTRCLLAGVHRGWFGLEYLYGTDHVQFLDGVTDREVVAAVERLPAKAPGQRDFLQLHLMSVHTAGRVEAEFERWRPARNRIAHAWERGLRPEALAEVRNHYDNAVLQVDDHLRRIFAGLEAGGYLRNAVVIVTADHGEALGDRPGSYVGHGRSLFQESIQVPLVVLDTAGPLPPIAELADLTDVAPTIADLIGMEAPASWQGRSVFRRPWRETVWAEFTTHPGSLPGGGRVQMEAVLWRTPATLYKLVCHRERGRETFRAVFCLTSDPDERRPIVDAAVTAELEARRQAHRGATRARVFA